jgi:hypothetical protein
MKAEEKSKTKEWKAISLQIRTEAEMSCERCGQKSKNKRILTVHHLDGDGDNNHRTNLVALCQSCHLKLQAIFMGSCGMHEFRQKLDIKDIKDVKKGIKIQKSWYTKLKQKKMFNPQ